MAKQETENMDKVVRAEMMRMLRERVNNPMREVVDFEYEDGTPQKTATDILLYAGYLQPGFGTITLAGMDYYRRETANPVLTWIGSNWFTAIVAGCTIGVSVWGIVGG